MIVTQWVAIGGAPLIQDGKRTGVCHGCSASHRFRREHRKGGCPQMEDGAQARRLLALAAIYQGSSRTEAARIGGVTLQIVRDWVVKFNAAGPDGLIDRKAPGKPSLLNATHRAALVEANRAGSDAPCHGSGCRSTGHRPGADAGTISLSVSRPTLSRNRNTRLPRTVGTQRPMPRIQKIQPFRREFAAELDKVRASSRAGMPIEVRFQDRRGIGREDRSRG